jgi:hypothetical protein
MKKSSPIVYLLIAVIVIVVIVGWRTVQEKKFANLALELSDGLLIDPVTVSGLQYSIPPSDIYNNGTEQGDYPTLTNPSFVSIAEVDEDIGDNILGISVNYGGSDGVHKFYPYQILNWHPVVIDEVDGSRYAITHDLFCMADRIYDISSEDDGFTYEASGSVYNNGMLLADNVTDNLLSQLRDEVVVGDIGTRPTRVETTTITWEAWKALYPSGEVLSFDTGYERDYTRHPFGRYDVSELIYFPFNSVDTRINPKWYVDNVSVGGEHLTLAEGIMEGTGVYNYELGGEDIIGLYDRALELTKVYRNNVNGEALTFVYDFDDGSISDAETGSTWSPFGLATAGEYKGTQLEYIDNQGQSFWMCWASNHPETAIAAIDHGPSREEGNSDLIGAENEIQVSEDSSEDEVRVGF